MSEKSEDFAKKSETTKRLDGMSLAEMMAEFETIVSWFNRDDLDVEMAIEKFAEGKIVAQKIREKLGEQENKIELIERDFAKTLEDDA
jgi:exodeoxyribonuclease VII small subunit